jgi:hypothetical protein
MADRNPSPFTLWLEDALSSWILHVAVIAIAAAAGGLYVAGWLGEGITGALIAGAAGVAVAALVLRPALSPAASRAGRLLGMAAAAAALLLTALPAIGTVAPGSPEFSADLGSQGDSVALPPGLAGPVRVLVRAPLPEGGMPTIEFRIGGLEKPLDGRLERTLGSARVGRGARATVAYDHSSVWLEGSLPVQPGALRLDRLKGEPAGPVHVGLYRERLPYGLLVVLCALALVLAAIADAFLGGKHGTAPLAGMGLAFALLVAANATPQTAVGTSLGALILGAMLGALAGWFAGMVVRRLVRPLVQPEAARRSRAA